MHNLDENYDAETDYELFVVFHIPHSSRAIPAEVRNSLTLSNLELEREILRLTDWYTDELFGIDSRQVVCFPVSRLVVDPERFPNDADEPMAAKGMGAVYTKTSDGQQLREQGGAWSRSDLMSRYYEPHHFKLRKEVADSTMSGGACVIVDCHSFPSWPLPFEADQSPDRPDLCIGTDPWHTPDSLVECVAEAARREDYSVAFNRPYAGAIVPLSFYRKHGRVFSVMIEVNRSLYMDEATGRKSASFDETREKLARLLAAIAGWRDAGLGLKNQVDGYTLEYLEAEGEELGYQDWDSGGPGAGAGRDTAWEYYGVYVVTHDAGYSFFETKEDALAQISITTDATTNVVIYDDEE